MGKFALAGGHSKNAPGASGYIDEYTEDRKVNTQLCTEMKNRGHSVKNCSNEASTVNAELASEVSSANKFGADIFCATHFNAYKTTTSKRGVEVWYYTGDATGKKIATQMAKDLSSLFGLPNRGAKATTDLYVIAYTNMTAVLPEVCFCDAKGDTDAYKKVSTSRIASVMADALEAGVGITSSFAGWQKNDKGWWYRDTDGSYPKNEWKKIVGKWYWFDEFGYMATGWKKINGKWYLFSDNGSMYSSECVELEGKWYAFSSSGAMVEGSIQLSDKGAMELDV